MARPPDQLSARRPAASLGPRPVGWSLDSAAEPDPVPARDATSERIEEFGIAPDPAVVRDLRHAVRRMCNGSDLSPDAGETAVLLASETLTNAIMHGGAPAHMVIRVSGNGVRVEVTDDSARAPVVAPASDEATNGRGIRLIDTLATRWGVQRHNHGKTVWFEVAPDSPC